MFSQCGGYDFEFVQGMDGTIEDIFMCQICLHPSRDPQLSVCCGHTFCKSCLDSTKKHSRTTRSSKVPCPSCRSKNFEVVPNKQVNRKIRSLHVFCTNKEKGCEWQGELNNLDVHLNKSNDDGCKYEGVECIYGCGETLQRQYLTMHMETECPHRKINCQYCNLSEIHCFITGDHKEECPKVVILCPNHCETDNILREDMDEHRKICSLEVVSCKYMKLGCGTRMARKEVEEHGKEKVEEHLLLATEKLEKFENTMSQLENAVSQLKWLSYLISEVASSSSGSEIAPVIFRITGFTNNKYERVHWKSPYFLTENEEFEMYAKVNFGRYYLKVYLSIGSTEYDDELEWPLRGRFDVAIFNQISDSEHYSRRIIFDDRCSDDVAGRNATGSWGISRFISYDQLCTASSTCEYVKDDSVYIEVSYTGPD